MKSEVYILIAVLLAWGGSAMAQVTIGNESVCRQKSNVVVTFDVISLPKSLKNNYKMVITPYLSNGTDTMRLPQVEVYGKVRYKRERQEASLLGNGNWTLPERAIFEGGKYAYRVITPYKPWMRTAAFAVDKRIVGCGCDCYDSTQELTDNVVIPPLTPIVEPVEQQAEKYEVSEVHKRWEFERELRVFFPVAKTGLNENLYDNKVVLDCIIRGILEIEKMECLRLNEVEITGFASPEGELKFNILLGEKRAEALREYVENKVKGLGHAKFHLVNGEENWEGLCGMVAESNLEYKREVLDIIDQKKGNERKNALRKLDGGRVYKYILRHFYPRLRNACYVAVYYDMLVDRAADVINAANKEIGAGRYDEALALLMPYAEDKRAWNSIGVCHMMLDDDTSAIEWFEKAVKAGNETARKNLEQLR